MVAEVNGYENAVSIQSASKFFGTNVAVNKLSLELKRGSIWGLIGPNGSGKTTTIRMIVGISPPTHGQVRLFEDLDPKLARARIGYVPETNGLIQRLKVIEHIVLVARLHHVSKKDAIKRAEALLDQFEIPETRDQPCSAMSKGMAQKVQMICAMLHEPDLLILDEPFSGLDPVNMELVKDSILNYKQANHTVLFSTHIMEHAEQICDSVVMVSNGKVLLNGSLEEVTQRAGNFLSIEFAGDPAKLTALPEATKVVINGSQAQISFERNTDRQQILRGLLDHVEIKRFDFGQESLHEVFIDAVAQETEREHQQESATNE